MMHSYLRTSAALLILGAVALPVASAATSPDRPRVVVLTDYFKDPDDKQSMIRLLVYANEFDLEGLVATSLALGDGSVRPELIRDTIDDYAAVFPNLRLHERPGFPYPKPERLRELVKRGAPVVRNWAGSGKGFPVPFPVGARDTRACDPAEPWLAAGRESEGAEHIIRVVDRDDPRPVWVVLWGGAMDLAQAIAKVRRERSSSEAARFIAKLRVYQVSWQDTGASWIWENVPDLFLIHILGGIGRGLLAFEEPADLGNTAWVERNITQGHGRLAATYPPANAYGKTAVNVKEGDTISFLHLLAPGLGNPERPEWGGWGGRFRRLDPYPARFNVDQDRHPTSEDPQRESQWTIARWKTEIYHEFAARLDWCVQPFSGANHPPVIQLEGDTSRRVLERRVTAGQKLTLSAAGTGDPDGDRLSYRWWHYREPGTYAGELSLQSSDTATVSLAVPSVSSPATAHVILEVTDSGQPSLRSYRRVVLTIVPPAGAEAR